MADQLVEKNNALPGDAERVLIESGAEIFVGLRQQVQAQEAEILGNFKAFVAKMPVVTHPETDHNIGTAFFNPCQERGGVIDESRIHGELAIFGKIAGLERDRCAVAVLVVFHASRVSPHGKSDAAISTGHQLVEDQFNPLKNIRPHCVERKRDMIPTTADDGKVAPIEITTESVDVHASRDDDALDHAMVEFAEEGCRAVHVCEIVNSRGVAQGCGFLLDFVDVFPRRWGFSFVQLR